MPLYRPRITILPVGDTPTPEGAIIEAQAIILQPADETNPGLVSTGSQTLAGDKVFLGDVSGPSILSRVKAMVIASFRG